MNRNRPTELGLSLLMLGASIADARAQDKPQTPVQRPARAEIRFDIPALPLADALTEFGRQTGMHMVMDAQLGQGRNSGRIQGRFTVDAALDRLLANTGLSYEYLDEQTIVLAVAGAPRPAASIPAFVSESIRVAQADAQGAAAAQAAATEADETLEEVVIRGVEFRYEQVESANKMPLSVKDTPQSVKVVTQDLIDFAGIRKFDDIYKIDASTGALNTGDHYPRQYYRGFEGNSAGNGIKVDGFRATDEVSLDLATFERFELVKGSTSTLYGQNAIGGMLNAISKMPKDEFGGEVKLEVGSFEQQRADVDLYGPLTQGGAVTYRLIGAYQDAGSYVDFARDDRVVIAPTVRFAIDDDTSITARINYQRFDFSPYYGFGAQFLGDDLGDPAQLTAENFRIPDVPRSRSGNSPQNDALKESSVAQLLLDHGMGSWTLRGTVQYARTDAENAGILMFGTDADGFTDTLTYGRDFEQDTFSAEVNLFGDVEWFGRTHTLFFGADYASLERNLVGPSGDYLVGASTGFSIINPDFSLLGFPDSFADYTSVFGMKAEHELAGFTAQALIRPTDGLIVSLGGRYSQDVDRARFSCCAAGDPFGPEDKLDENAFTYQAGITYALTPLLNVYASHGTTFEPQSGFVADGTPIEPEEGVADEIGLKGETPGRKLSYSLALFDMERTNIAQEDIGTPYLVPIGTQRSRGVEVDFQGELRPGWEVYGSLAVLDAEYIEGEFKGIQPPNAPELGISLFTSYEIQGGGLRGLGFGLGAVHKAGRGTQDFYFGYGGANTPIDFLDDFTEVDVRVFYTRNRWQFELSGTNVFDEMYYSNPAGRLALGYQASPPAQVIGSLRYRF